VGRFVRALRIALASRATLTLTPSHLLALLALTTATLLMGFYLALLHEAVERGALARAKLSSGAAGTRPVAQFESAHRPVRTGLVDEPGR
jgi:hypothetical protein